MNKGRYEVLPSRGTLLVSTDLHGNGDDFAALRDIFLKEREKECHWALLGDLVHGPSPAMAALDPRLYDYPDRSGEMVAELRSLMARFPDHIHYVLGNHDHGHIGGPHPGRFYGDEVKHLESRLDQRQRAGLKELFWAAPLALLAPCGAMLCHGSPDDRLQSLHDLNTISYLPQDNDSYQAHLLTSLLTHYGQAEEVTARLLTTVSHYVGFPVTLVIHGHDRDDQGWFAEGDNQLCPVIFGAYRETKRYLRLDLDAHYRNVHDLQEGREILRLHP